MKRKLIVVDTETAGTDPTQHSILSFAAVVYHDGGIAGKFKVLIQESPLSIENPPAKFTEDFRFPHNGIAIQDVLAEGLSPWFAVQQFVDFLQKNELYGKQTLVAHNATFDSGFLKRLWRLAGQNFNKQWDYRMLCTQTAALLLEQAGRINLPGGSASLDNVAAVYGLRRETADHDALEDAILAARVLKKMVDRLS